mmetsp:Transcript_71624/g.187754  ORF Transcript_71624/g.187754 Transcript_71624/m.187754 type:complete len:203 (-) Transcript_71624:234-842(-)
MAAISSQKPSRVTLSCSSTSSVSASIWESFATSPMFGWSFCPRWSWPSSSRLSSSCLRRRTSGAMRGVRQAARHWPNSATFECCRRPPERTASAKQRMGGERGWARRSRRLFSRARSCAESSATLASSGASPSASSSRFSFAFSRARLDAASEMGKTTVQRRPPALASALSSRAVRTSDVRLCSASSVFGSTGCSPATVSRS